MTSPSHTPISTNRYAQRFQALEQSNQKLFMPFTVLGWPNRDTSLNIVKTMIDSGAGALELGIAFSDPMADGPVIQAAAKETLDSGFNVNDALALLSDIRNMDEDIPIGVMVYYNIVLVRGVDTFIKQLAEAGVDGLLIPDLPPEAAEEVYAAAQANGIQLVFIVSPLTTDERLAQIQKYAGGFLYVVSRLGITGVEERYDQTLEALIQRLHQKIKLPACVGFGISTPEQVQAMVKLGADGAITGSAIIKHIQENPSDIDPGTLQKYLTSMVKAAMHATK